MCTLKITRIVCEIPINSTMKIKDYFMTVNFSLNGKNIQISTLEYFRGKFIFLAVVDYWFQQAV